MIWFCISNASGNKDFQHAEGPLEFGRGPQGELPRFVITDSYVSRDHMCVQELDDKRIQVKNLSKMGPIQVTGRVPIGTGAEEVLDLPVRLHLGKTTVQIARERPKPSEPEPQSGLSTVMKPARTTHAPATLESLGETPGVETLIHWFETVISIQQSASGSSEFYDETARAIVDLVGLDRGLVFLRKNGEWKIEASHTPDSASGPQYSSMILEQVAGGKCTFFKSFGQESSTQDSLYDIEAVVAAPILDLAGEVAGVVYGSRQRGTGTAGPEIRPLEAQVVQVLAAIVAAGLVREQKEKEALRATVQFEQFFSPELARELEKDPQLLEGREREVTILFSDLRGFSSLSEKLGPQQLFPLMQDIMDFQTEKIREHGGVIVDYYGDGLLAMWNSPQERPDHAVVACRAALAIRDDLPELSARWEAKVGEPLRLGIGLNTGQALVGNTGSKSKFKYGPMGPTVNLASRVESATKFLGVPILLTGSTSRQLNESFATRRLCTARLAGFAEGVALYELHTEEAAAEWLERRAAYESALEHFESRRWAETCREIYPLLQDLDSRYDVPSLNLLSRAVDCLQRQPEHFDPCLDLKRPGGKAV